MTEDDPHAHDRMIGRQALSIVPKKAAEPETKMIWTCKCKRRNLATLKHCPHCGEPR